MKPLLIISAEDGGASTAIDRGILDCIDDGPVTNVEVLVGGANAEALAEHLARRPGIGVGLHLALTRAVALASTRLAPSGKPLPATWTELARRMAKGVLGREDLAAEIWAQITRARSLGLHLDHLSGHDFVHLMPGVADVVARLARDAGLPPRVRISRTPAGEMARDPRAVALRAAASFARRTAWKTWVSPDRVVGIADLGEVRDLERVLSRVGSGARSVELLVHPGDRPLPGEEQPPAWGYGWPAEREALLGTHWRPILGRDYLLGTYRDL